MPIVGCADVRECGIDPLYVLRMWVTTVPNWLILTIIQKKLRKSYSKMSHEVIKMKVHRFSVTNNTQRTNEARNPFKTAVCLDLNYYTKYRPNVGIRMEKSYDSHIGSMRGLLTLSRAEIGNKRIHSGQLSRAQKRIQWPQSWIWHRSGLNPVPTLFEEMNSWYWLNFQGRAR